MLEKGTNTLETRFPWAPPCWKTWRRQMKNMNEPCWKKTLMRQLKFMSDLSRIIKNKSFADEIYTLMDFLFSNNEFIDLRGYWSGIMCHHYCKNKTLIRFYIFTWYIYVAIGGILLHLLSALFLFLIRQYYFTLVVLYSENFAYRVTRCGKVDFVQWTNCSTLYVFIKLLKHYVIRYNYINNFHVTSNYRQNTRYNIFLSYHQSAL